MPKIPLYLPKWAEEAVRGVAVAVVLYAATSITASGVPETKEAILSLVSGAAVVAWAAVRAALNKTSLTPTPPSDG